MSIFVDTAALYAFLDADDANHAECEREWRRLLEHGEPFVTHNYVLVETCALVQHRLGVQAMRDLEEVMLPALQVLWIDEQAHREAVSALLTAGRRDLSLVDCATFGLMREWAITRAFTFARHFDEQGFQRIPAPIVA
jgi:predicted nucleic acid-binding protein